MANDDDESSRKGESSPPRDLPQRHKTMMGMGFSDASPGGGRVSVTHGDEPSFAEEYASEATEIASSVITQTADGEIHAAVDRAWDDMFPAESTSVTLKAEGAEAPVDDEPWGEGLAEETDTSQFEEPWDDGINAMSLAEDSLPDAIREPTPTLEDPDDSLSGPLAAYGGDNTSINEFEAAHTQMLDSPFESDPTVAKLVALDGPASGQEFFASGLRNTVGRGTHNAIVVPDVALSRQHFEVVRNADDSYSLVDLQSINGTLLNGTKVREADLFHGDRIEAGKSRFQFVVTGSVAPPSRQRRLVPAATSTMGGKSLPPPAAPAQAHSSVNRVVLGVSVVAVLISILLMIVVGVLLSREQPAPKPSGPDAATIYLLGVEAVKSRDWDRAQTEFERARDADPQIHGVDGQLERLTMERAAKKALEDATQLLDDNKPTEAAASLEVVPAESVYAAEAEDLLREARKAEVLALYQIAQDAMSAGDHARVAELTDKILARVPTHPGALALKERLASAVEPAPDAGFEEEEEEQEIAVTAPRGKKPSTTKKRKDDDDWGIELVGSSKSSGTKSSSGTARVPNLTQGFLLYRTRKFTEAEAFFDKAAKEPGPAAASTQKIARAVKDFRSNYPSGVSAMEAKRWAEAQKALTAAKRADSVVGDYFDADLRGKLARVEANLGLADLKGGDPVSARKRLDKSRRYSASDSSGTKLQREIEAEARSLYVKAQGVRKSDPAEAGRLCRKVKAILPASHEIHKDAAKLLKSLPSR